MSGEVFLIPWQAHIDQRADDAPSQESLIVELEARALDGIDEAPEPAPRRPPASQEEMRHALERLNVQDRTALIGYFLGHQRQRDIAERAGISQPALQLRIQRAVQRLRWLLGPGALTVEELAMELEGTELDARSRRALLVFWQTTSYSFVHRDLGLSHASARRLVLATIEKLSGPLRRRFDALLRDGRLLFLPQPQPRTPQHAEGT